MTGKDLEAFLFAYYWDITDCEEYPVELTLPLNQRAGLLEQLEKYVVDIEDINQGNGFNPLMTAVENGDAPMTKYLIEHGASVFYWPEMESGETNYYLDDLDINYMHQSWSGKRFVDALLETAKVLVTVGGYSEDYHGLCLSIDIRKREISFTPLQPLF